VGVEGTLGAVHSYAIGAEGVNEFGDDGIVFEVTWSS
jgi:hypothetical protein